MTPRAALGALLTLLLLVVLGCGDGADGRDEDDMDATDATARLETQREDVRAAARSLLSAAEEALPGVTVTSGGRYRGCESAFDEEFKNFHYLVQARIDVAAASGTVAPYVESLRPALEEVGFTTEELEELPNGFVTLVGAKDDVRASFTHTGAGAFVGLSVAGPCVDVPAQDRADWLTRDEPTPEVR